jgi:O-antigen biosynthesis protein
MSKNRLSRYLSKGTKIIRSRGIKAITNPIGTLEEFADASHHLADIEILKMVDYCDEDLKRNSQLIEEFTKIAELDIKTVNWFIPPFRHAFGGVYTILRLADFLTTKKQIHNRFIFYGDEAQNVRFKEAVYKPFPKLVKQEVILLKNEELNNLPFADISIATRWDSAPLVMKFNKTKGKFYFIQDYEPLFFPAGSLFAAAEKTYQFGFYGIINTPGLADIYIKEYGGKAEYFVPAIDTKLFYPVNRQFAETSKAKPFRIFFYARPEASRNGFELGIGALEKIKAKYGPLVEIYTAGSNWNPKDYGLQNTIRSLGILPYEKTPELYRNTDLGLIFMFTKHPSYLPFELMACGCPVITNKNPTNDWFFKDNENCLLTQPSISCIFEKIDKLVTNPTLCKQLSSGGLNSTRDLKWDNQMERIYRFITKKNPSKILEQSSK